MLMPGEGPYEKTLERLELSGNILVSARIAETTLYIHLHRPELPPKWFLFSSTQARAQKRQKCARLMSATNQVIYTLFCEFCELSREPNMTLTVNYLWRQAFPTPYEGSPLGKPRITF